MAAPNIPNLFSLSGSSASRGRGLGRGRSVLEGEESSDALRVKNDQIVRQTDQDANVSRLSAVQLGYLDDEFAQLFTPMAGPQRRFPIINRGTYIRTKAIDLLVDGFLKSCPNQKKQIISLGAGSDTRYFRIAKGKTAPGMVYHEIDFPQNTKQKISTINRSQDLKILIGDMQKQSDVELHSSDYHIHAFDLRDLDPLHATTPPTSLEHIDPSLPTLVISECCLVYLIPRSADAVVKYFAEKLFPSTTPIGIVLYEPTNPFDSFGKVMVSNLAARGIVLQTLKKYGSLETQKERMKFYGFRGGACAKDLNCLHDAWIDDTEKDRISKLEMLDEVEELQLLLKHYCIAWGWRGGEVEDSLWNKWKSMVENTK